MSFKFIDKDKKSDISYEQALSRSFVKPFSSVLIYCLIIQLSTVSYSQSYVSSTSPFADSSYNFIEATIYGSTQKRTPFWIQTNQFGIVPKQGPAVGFHTGLEHYWNISNASKKNKPWRVGGGIEMAANFSAKTKILIPQLFGTIRFKNWELFAGRKKQRVGLADSTLGMGSYIWSGNAMPIPKIQIGTTRFVSVPFTSNWVALNAFYSDGFLEKNRSVTSDLRLHQKALYIRLGKPASKLRIYGGFNHQVEWGGKSPYQTVDGKMPKGFKSYLDVITGKRAPGGENLTHFDSTNRIGNHLGSVDLGLEIELNKTSLFLYRQNIYEDGSLYFLNNVSDGLNGIRFRRKGLSNSAFRITEIVVEYLNTTSQGGNNALVKSKNIRGRDDYFNNAQVRDGWSYYDRTIGTPFIMPTSDTRYKYPVDSDFFTSNNRVSVWNLGLKGDLADRIIWIGKFSYSQNFGTYNVPFKYGPRQVSAILAMQIPVDLLGGSTIKGLIAADVGRLYTNTLGFSLGIQRKLF